MFVDTTTWGKKQSDVKYLKPDRWESVCLKGVSAHKSKTQATAQYWHFLFATNGLNVHFS